jgi:prepilin-type processing-associated H-X9-DG protein
VVENYMPDAQVLYCPTVAGSMPIPVCQRSNIPPLYAGQDGGAGVGRMKKAGGFDGKAILFGDWSDLGYFSKAYDKARAVFSDYAYRNTPIALVAGFEANTPPYPAPWTPARLKPFQLGGTKPAVMTQVAVPAFKTHKTLGQRSIAADSFGRGHDGNYGSIQAPGDGNFAHKDGYNVLYGDGHAAWYADSIQRLIYWPEPDLGSMPYSSQNVISDLCVMASSQGSGLGWWRMEGGGRWDALSTERTGPWDSNQNCGAAVWHLLDVAAGIDVDAQ